MARSPACRDSAWGSDRQTVSEPSGRTWTRIARPNMQHQLTGQIRLGVHESLRAVVGRAGAGATLASRSDCRPSQRHPTRRKEAQVGTHTPRLGGVGILTRGPLAAADYAGLRLSSRSSRSFITIAARSSSVMMSWWLKVRGWRSIMHKVPSL